MQMSLADPVAARRDRRVEGGARRPPRASAPALYRDPSWRDRARPATLAAWSHRWSKIDVEETDTHHDVVGITLDQLAAERGTTPFDLMLDLALSDGFATRFRVVMDNDGDDEIGDLLADKRTLLGSLRRRRARQPALRRVLLDPPARALGARAQGALRSRTRCGVSPVTRTTRSASPTAGSCSEGFYADLVAFDPETVGCAPVERVHDQPGGADRLVVRSTGVEHMWVNGVATRIGGEEVAGVASGRVLRS